MVFGVARRTLRSQVDAEDVFQATFLVLARKARSLRSRDSVSSWLYGVAVRLARRARSISARRLARETYVAAAVRNRAAISDPLTELSLREAQEALDAELSRLAEKYRAPLVLCCLEGQSRDEAARHLGWSVNQVKSRLEQARDILHRRLVRRGLTLTGVLAAELLNEASAGQAPPQLTRAAIRAACSPAAGVAEVSRQACTLAGSKSSRPYSSAKAAALLMAVSLSVTGGLLLAPHQTPATDQEAALAENAPLPAAGESKRDELSTFRGRVVDVDNKPVGGATVTAPSHPKTMAAVSDADGRFELAVGPPVRQQDSLLLLVRAQDGRSGLASVSREEKNPGPIVVRPGRELSVDVTDAAGKPVVDARVCFLAEMRPIAIGRTDADGKWVERMPADAKDWSVFASKAGAGFDYTRARTSRDYSRPWRSLPARLALTLDGGRKLRVRTVEANGKPVSGVKVGPWTIERAGRGSDINIGGIFDSWPATDKDGLAIIDWLPARFLNGIGILSVSEDFYAPQHSTLIAPDDGVAEITIKLLPRQNIFGRVIGPDGRPAVGARVSATGKSNGTNDGIGYACTDADGNYRMRVNAEQTYIVIARAGDLVSPYRKGILVGGREPVRGLDFVLGPATRVHGRVSVVRDNQPCESWIRISSIGPKGYTNDDLPHIETMVRADKNGLYEFFVGPGEYLLIGPAHTENTKISIPAAKAPAEIVHDFYLPRPEEGTLAGRVVDAAGKPVVAAAINASYETVNTARYFWPLKSDDNGRFESKRALEPMVFFIRTADRTRGAVARVGAEQPNVEITVGPFTTASGRLLDLSNKPIAARELRYGIRVWTGEPEKSPFMDSFGGTAKTDAKGRFTLTDLVSGETYRVSLILDQSSSLAVAKVLATSPGPLDIGDLNVDAADPGPYVPPSPAKLTANAFNGGLTKAAQKRVEAALGESRRMYTRPLILFGKPNDPACVDLFRLFQDPPTGDEGSAAAKRHAPTPNELRWEYELVALDMDQASVKQLAKDLKVELNPANTPLLVTLDANGDLLGSHVLKLGDKGQLDSAAIAAFLAKHKFATRNAETMLAEAQRKAKAEGKRVFFIASASWCGPCRTLARFIDSQMDELGKHYVFVELDISRDERADTVHERIKGNRDGGVPWYAILDENSKIMVSSEAPQLSLSPDQTNIGYPVSTAAIGHVIEMLKKTAPRLAPEKLEELRKVLSRK
jgi:RNA polymerase sigma factor (sigma-70 family)